MLEDFKTLEDEIRYFYNINMLIELYKAGLKVVEAVLPLNHTLREQRRIKNFIINKKYLSELFKITLTEEKYFKIFLSNLPTKISTALKVIAASAKDISKENLELIIDESISLFSKSKKEDELILALCFVEHKKGEYFFDLPTIIKNEIRKRLDLQANYPEIKKVIEIKDKIKTKTEFVFEDKGNIVNNLIEYFNYFEHPKTLNFLKSNKPSKKTLENAKKFLNIKEFYNSDDKDLNFIRTEMLINIFSKLKYQKNKNDIYSNLKEIIESYKKYATDKDTIFCYNFLDYLKLPKRFINSDKDKIKNNYFKLGLINFLKDLDCNKWIFIEDITLKFEINKLDLISQNFLNDTYFEGKVGSNYRYTYIYKDLKNELVNKPAIKANLFLLASIGVLDIVYDLPKNKVKCKDKNYLSIYDGLKAVRLTKLGAYLLGLTNNYESETLLEEGKVSFDEKDLLAKFYPEISIKGNLIKKYGKKVTSNTYRVSYSSIMEGCNTKKKLIEKIKHFNETFKEELPEFWKEFLANTLIHYKPFARLDNIQVYKINHKDEKLLELLTKDNILKSLILKVENMHIAIEQENLNKFIKRLAEFGYIF